MSAPQSEVVSPRWESFLGFFIENKLVVFVLATLLIGAGLAVSPFHSDPSDSSLGPVPVDAIPDIGENQQIVFTQWPGRSPQDVEDQLTYPLTAALLGVPGVRTVRSSSMLGLSSILVIFEEEVEFYWSRSRVLEKLSSLPAGTLPSGVKPALGPDATALGQVYWYTLEGRDPSGNLVGGWDLHELRSIQDWTIRSALQAAPGVADVASIGGFVQEYQVDVDPESLLAYAISLEQVARAVRESNLDVGARTLEINRAEYVVRSLGFLKSKRDLEETVVQTRNNTPIRIRDLARVTLGPAQRRGVLDDAGAEAVGGVVVARYGSNPMEVITTLEEKIAAIAPGLPTRTLEDGTKSQVTIRPFYDRRVLINETLDTLSTALFQQILVTILVVLVMLRNLRTSLLVSSVLPLAVLGAFVAMKWSHVDANIMALAGIAIAIGTMVDMSIVFTENIAEHLRLAHEDEDRARVVAHAAAEVAPAVLTSVLTTIVSFLPVLALTATEGKLFTPLALTKSFAMVAALVVSMLILPALAHLLLPAEADTKVTRAKQLLGLLLSRWRDTAILAIGVVLLRWTLWCGLAVIALGLLRIAGELVFQRHQRHLRWAENALAIATVTLLLSADWMPLGLAQGRIQNLFFVALAILGLLVIFLGFERGYRPLLQWALRNKVKALCLPAFVVVFGFTAWLGVDRIFASMPEAVRSSRPVDMLADKLPGFGSEFMPSFDEGSFLYMPTTMPHASVGHARQSLQEMDAAIAAIPEVERAVGKLGRAETPLDPAPVSMFEIMITYKSEYGLNKEGERVRQWREHIRSPKDIWTEITQVAQLPGITSAPMLMPINTRLLMLQSGMRAPMGIKVKGPNLATLEAFSLRLEQELKKLAVLQPQTVFADRVVGKPYIEIDIDRQAIGRYGLSIREVQNVIQVALGGRTLTSTVEGRERYPVRVRYMREERDSIEALARIFVPTPAGEQIPLEQLSTIRYVKGPQVIKSEDTFLTSYVLFDKQSGLAETAVVEQVRAHLQTLVDEGALLVPAGVQYEFTGSYENQQRSQDKLQVLVPLALLVVFLILYLQFRRISTALIIFSSATICIAGGFALIWLYGQPWFLDFRFFGVAMRELFHVGTINLSVAVWIGFIALLGIATDAGVVMATYLAQRFAAQPPQSVEEVHARAMEAGTRRLRPCLMTTATTALALLPVISSHGRGSDVMVPMAIPSIGGMTTILLTLFTVPVLYAWVEESRLRRRMPTANLQPDTQE